MLLKSWLKPLFVLCPSVAFQCEAHTRCKREKRRFGRPAPHSGVVECLEDRTLLATFTVDVLDDSAVAGHTTLRDAVAGVNASGDSTNEIDFDPGLAGGTINLTQDKLELHNNVSIVGLGANQLTVQRSTASGTPDFEIFLFDGGVASISGLTISNGANGSGAGILNTSILTVADCDISGNGGGFGGGIYNTGTLTVIGSAIHGNSGQFAGGIYNGGTAVIINSTIANNSADFTGGGIYDFSGALTITNSTIAGNTDQGVAGGIACYSSTAVQLNNTIVAGSTDHSGTPSADLDGNSVTASHSLIQNPGNSGLTSGANGNITGVSPQLLSLGDYGGTTLTMPFAAGSPVLDAGSNAIALDASSSPLTTDQRGAGYARMQSVTGTPTVDIGAFENTVYVVDTTSDVDDGDYSAGQFSLREAIGLANQNFDATILFSTTLYSGGPVAIDLTTALPGINKNVTIQGPGANLLTVERSRAGGTADFRIFATIAGTSTISGLTISNGSSAGDSGGGIENFDTLTIVDCDISGNTASGAGGGIYSQGTSLTVVGTSIHDNSSTLGGGIGSRTGSTTIINSTIANNSASVYGGGIHTISDLSITNSTIAHNSDGGIGGIYSVASTAVILNNSIVAGSTDLSGTPIADIQANGVTADHSLIQNPGLTGITNGTNGNIVGLDPRLAPLGYYGGTTQTMALYSDSPAINAGSNALAVDASSNPLTIDQRGTGFPRFQSLTGTPTVDIGAFEVTTYLVDTLSDVDNGNYGAGNLSLREAIGLANAHPGAIIGFSASLYGVEPAFIELASALPTLSTLVTIQGPGADNLTIERPGGASHFSIFHIDTNGVASISGLTIAGGYSDHSGGAIVNEGVVAFVECAFLSNTAAFFGGAIYSLGTSLVVVDCTISGNSSTKSGGGIYVAAGTAVISGSTIDNNSADHEGGGIGVGSSASIINSTIANNISTDAFGGGIGNFGLATVVNSTIAGNRDIGGGGVFNDGSTFQLYNSIVSGSRNAYSGAPINDLTGVFDARFSLIQNAGATGISDGTNGNIVGVDPQLLPLGNYGGLTATMPTTSGSRAIDAGSDVLAVDADGNALSTDQRGAGFSRFLFGTATTSVDIGAVEFFAASYVVDTTSDVDDGDYSTGNLSLREAVGLANTRPGSTITFASALYSSGPATIDLLSALPEIDADMTISGPGANNLIIQRSSLGGTDDFSVFDFEIGTSTISGLTIKNGSGENGGGILNNANLQVIQCFITGNNVGNGDGGGIYNGATLTVSGTTFQGNAADRGGAIFNFGDLTVNNSTFSGNTAGSEGGGIRNGGVLTVTNSTFSGNSDSGLGGAVYSDTFEESSISNSILAGSTNIAGGAPIADIFTVDTSSFVAVHVDVKNSLIQNAGATGIADGTDGNIVGADPLLSALGNYGGPTPTMTLLPGSPAIDAGDNTLATSAGILTDQRGLNRPINLTVDMGAAESQGFTIAVNGGNSQVALVSTDFANPLVVLVTSAGAGAFAEPVAGGLVIFTPPSTGASATLATSPATIAANGTASVTATANATPGTYDVTASARGNTVTANLNLTNRVVVVAGTSDDFTSVDAGQPDRPGDLVSDLLGATTFDNPGAVAGMAVTGLASTSGYWQYSIDGGANWTTFGAVSDTSATLLGASANDRIRFIPTSPYATTGSITFRAWDQTDGNVDGAVGIDVSINGGLTAYSEATGTSNLDVTSHCVLVDDVLTVTSNSTGTLMTFSYASGTIFVILVDGNIYGVDPTPIKTVNINRTTNSGPILLYGSTAGETFDLAPGSATWTEPAPGSGSLLGDPPLFTLNATGFQTYIVDGGGGADQTTMHTSESFSDIFVGAPGNTGAATYATMYAASQFSLVAYHSTVTGVNDAGHAGDKVAYLFASAADDHFDATASAIELSGAGAGGSGAFDLVARNFPLAIGYNNVGNTGTHTAMFHASTVADAFVGASTIYAQLFSTGSAQFDNRVYNYSSVQADSDDTTPGVDHRAFLYSSTNGDAFTATGVSASLTGSTAGAIYSYTVQGFTEVNAFNGGSSSVGTAQFTGIANDDMFVGSSMYALLSSGAPSDAVQYRNVAYGFSTNTAIALEGSTATRASLIDSAGNDAFLGNGGNAGLLNNTVTNFKNVDAYSLNGGVDTISNTAIDFVFRKFGNWSN